MLDNMSPSSHLILIFLFFSFFFFFLHNCNMSCRLWVNDLVLFESIPLFFLNGRMRLYWNHGRTGPQGHTELLVVIENCIAGQKSWATDWNWRANGDIYRAGYSWGQAEDGASRHERVGGVKLNSDSDTCWEGGAVLILALSQRWQVGGPVYICCHK